MTMNDRLKKTAEQWKRYVVSVMTQNVSVHAVPSMSVPNVLKPPDSLNQAKDCFTKKDLTDMLTRVLVKLQDKWSKVAETPPKSTAIYEDANLIRMVLEELKVVT